MSNIRQQRIPQFSGQTWLTQKRNPGNVNLPENKIATMITAEWGNRVDTSFKQTNEAFNGLPVNAVNVQSCIHTAKHGRTEAGQSEEILVLFTGVPVGHWAHVQSFAYAYGNEDLSSFTLFEHSALFRRDNESTMGLKAELSMQTLHDTGTGASFTLKEGLPDQVHALLNGSASNFALDWVVDFTVRVVPGPLPLPDALEDVFGTARGNQRDESLSSTPQTATGRMPNLLSRPEQEARAMLQRHNLKIRERQIHPTADQVGLVVGQEPAPGADIEPGTSIMLVIGVTEQASSDPAVNGTIESQRPSVGDAIISPIIRDPRFDQLSVTAQQLEECLQALGIESMEQATALLDRPNPELRDALGLSSLRRVQLFKQMLRKALGNPE
jgi:hypothetical protein